MGNSYRFVGQEPYRITGPWPEPKIIESQPPYPNHPSLNPRNFYETGLEESLEEIIFQDTPEKDLTTTGTAFGDQRQSLQSTIKALFNEILTREILNNVLLKKIDSDGRKTETYLHEIRTLTTRDYARQFDDLGKRRTQLDGRILDLEKEKRQEYLACWKDLGQLKKYVLLNLKDLWELRRNKDYLGTHNDGQGSRADVQETQAYPGQ